MKHNRPMGLLQRIFGNSKDLRETPVGGPPTSLFHESESTSNELEGSRNAPRRELVQVILRDTMRKHGIPSDWIECRILSTVSRSGRTGLHVNFVVRQAHDQLLGYVFAFQESFQTELGRFDPRARDWLVSLGWEFQGHKQAALMPEPGRWASASGRAPLAQAGSLAPLIDPAGKSRAFAPTDDQMAAELPKSDDEIQRDLEALFAIRDAALADAARKPQPADDDRPDFQPTQPFDDDEPLHRRS